MNKVQIINPPPLIPNKKVWNVTRLLIGFYWVDYC